MPWDVALQKRLHMTRQLLERIKAQEAQFRADMDHVLLCRDNEEAELVRVATAFLAQVRPPLVTCRRCCERWRLHSRCHAGCGAQCRNRPCLSTAIRRHQCSL